MPVAKINLVIEDTDLERYTITVYKNWAYSLTPGDWDTDAAQLLWDTIRPLIDGILVSCETVFPHEVQFWTNNIVDVLSDIQEKARFTFRDFYVDPVLTLPTFKESLFVNAGAGKAVDITDSDVAAFIALMTDDGGYNAMDKHGTIIESFVKAEQSWG